jgi:glycogen debranching enzyme
MNETIELRAGSLDETDLTILRSLAYNTVRKLSFEHGIRASSKTERFGCLFGRDSLVSALELIEAYNKSKDPYLLSLVKTILLSLANLQGKKVTIESGEEPGKIIHEYRTENHNHLTDIGPGSWYVYPDKTMRIFDSVDSTPLFLIAAARYIEVSNDQEFVSKILPAAYRALTWIDVYGDTNKDGFVDYRFHPERTHGGLVTQSWMDSSESLFHEDGSEPAYPIAPVEVQAYVYLALRLWTPYFGYNRELETKAATLKEAFNRAFVQTVHPAQGTSIASAVDGNGKPAMAIRSSIGHILWAGFQEEHGGRYECILEEKYIAGLVDRLMSRDLFEPNAGIRTLSTLSSRYDPQSYHNGSIWPHDNAMILEGLVKFNYPLQAASIRSALVNAWHRFGPVELYTHIGTEIVPYQKADHGACREQAWSAAAMLAQI